MARTLEEQLKEAHDIASELKLFIFQNVLLAYYVKLGAKEYVKSVK